MEVLMSTPTDAQIAAAKAYEALFVPALFGQWASRVADAANLVAGESVLDVACGTGVLAREARLRTGPKGYVAGLDPSVGMLAVAKEFTPSVDWQQGTAEAMPFTDATFDVVVSQFGLMFMDRDRAIHEMLRVLKPNGRLVVAVWDTVENIPVYAAEIALLERLAGTQAADALRAPFVLGNRELLAKVFNDADADAVTISTSKCVARFPSIRAMVEADLRGWLPVMGVKLTEEEIGRVLNEAENVLDSYVTDDGRVTFEVRAHLVTAKKP
ncbi:MAG TPA: methyltransferase domain-containing protein [Myxococcota bacterium]|jgi:SAM-dependent methyltransferase|nr:methyltransferase domain-containing protein [Myxococcota bacterium]